MTTPSITRRSFGKLTLSVGAALLLGATATQAAFPEKSVRIVVPYAPGGPNDVVARLVGNELSNHWKQPVVIENRPGGGATIGGATVAAAEPDGYTLLLASSTFATHPTLFSNLPYDPATSLKPVVKIADGPIILTATLDLPVTTGKELVEYAKKNPDKVSFGTSGNASTPHLAGEYFNQKSGAKITHVPYKGDGPTILGILNGTLPVAFTGLAAAIPHVKSGKIKALGVSSDKRLDVLADVPTIGETLPGYDLVGWFSLMAPAKTPQPIVDAIADATMKVIANPELKQRLESSGLYVSPMGPTEFDAYFKNEVEKLGTLIKGAGLKVQ